MGFGTFDGLHPGHMYYLRQLDALGDELIVLIARDRNVKKTKGKLPQHNEKERLSAVKDLKFVNRVLIGHSSDYYHWIRKIRPDIIGLGYDQMTNLDGLKKTFPDIEIVRLDPYEPEKYKSSLLRDKE
ncbi:adenylyltransferase/cytidyltransferase family protein [Candidatus Peregrinibacteria bacterium]|nr:adenylyltransferase/cytidyltransferase family protein [Candidatus Peregrinibacteria bacterium]